jgi:PhzF family phenazine biosynthesis protein
MTTTPCFLVDAFADAPFRGNPAAVCLLAAPKPARWLQAVAAEWNLSETAFVTPRRGGFGLRWFTPACEVDLCGHATLAAAHVLWSEGLAPAGEALRFTTRSGVLTAARVADAVELDMPAGALRPAKTSKGLAKALGAAPVDVCRGGDDLLVQLRDERAVRGLRPDFAALARLPYRGVVVTARAARGADFVSRCFYPAVGVPEDPVTGSAHCALAVYWAVELARTTLRGRQVSARGGCVDVTLRGDRALLRGGAVTVARSELLA